jgi:DNA polymerase-1
MFPGLRRWQDELIYKAKKSGFVETLCGLRIKVEGLCDPLPWKRDSAERRLINNVAQGSAAEVMKHAMIKIHKEAPFFGLLVQVYDELLFETAEPEYELPFVVDCMTNAVKLDVPLTVDGKSGLNWAEAH